MKRSIHFQSDLGTERNENLQAWSRANGVSPEDIPIASWAEVDTDANEITFTVFQRNEDGTKVIDKTTSDWAYLKCPRTVPLLSAPENHNL